MLLELLESSVTSLPNLETNLVKYIQTLSKQMKGKLDGVSGGSSHHLTETKLAPPPQLTAGSKGENLW